MILNLCTFFGTPGILKVFDYQSWTPEDSGLFLTSHNSLFFFNVTGNVNLYYNYINLLLTLSTYSEFENLDTPDSFFSIPDKLTNIISRDIINIKNSESDHPPRAKKNYKNPCSLCHKQVRENQKGIQCNN